MLSYNLAGCRSQGVNPMGYSFRSVSSTNFWHIFLQEENIEVLHTTTVKHWRRTGRSSLEGLRYVIHGGIWGKSMTLGEGFTQLRDPVQPESPHPLLLALSRLFKITFKLQAWLLHGNQLVQIEQTCVLAVLEAFGLQPHNQTDMITTKKGG